jgi:hypothetical protein
MCKDARARSTELLNRIGALAIAAALACVALACGDDTEDATRIEIHGYSPPPAPPPPEPLYDAEGRLRESDRTVAGVRLPVGLRPLPSTSTRVHRFESEATLDSLRQYFGSRVVTGLVEPLGEGVVYRNATPIERLPGAPPGLDVMVAPVGANRARVELRELAAPPEKIPTPEEAREIFERMMNEPE